MRGLGPKDVEEIMANGMLCQAMRHDSSMTVWDAEAILSDENLDRHRHDHEAFGDSSPYISTSGGTYLEGSVKKPFNKAQFAFDTALAFAVLTEQKDGWIFYGYHLILGRPAGRHAEFSEEVRDFHQHPQWSEYRDEGEIAAAVRIPPRRIRRAEFYRYDSVMEAIKSKSLFTYDDYVDNKTFLEPETVLSARAVI
jgi:hypothetical protein